MPEPQTDVAPLLTEKGLPARSAGHSIASFLATGPSLDEFWTPLLALDDAALDHNIGVMARWSEAHGFSLAPHGKTTMSPALWNRQTEAGAWAISLATLGQVRTARAHGVQRVLLANEAVEPQGLAWLAAELADPAFGFSCWADSVETVEAMERALAGIPLPRPIEVSVELGAPGGRTGARTTEAARAVAERIHSSPVLRLAGVAGYEGALAHDRSPQALAAVRGYLQRMLALHESLADLYDGAEVVLSAGGSAYFDLVDEVFDPARSPLPNTRVVLRSGAYLTHDDGFYRGISPLEASRDATLTPAESLRPALRAYARVLSRPEPGLALLDAGKRDLPYDEGLPVPLAVARELGGPETPLRGASVSAMNDQHSFLRLSEDAALAVGDVVRLGISHPCTAFDKWRLLPVLGGDQRTVVGLVRTYF